MASTAKMGDKNVISNRDDPIPVLRIPSHDVEDEYSPSASENDSDVKGGRRERFFSNVDKLKDKVGEYSTTEARQTLQDRMFASILSQIVPEDVGEGGDDTYKPTKKDRRSKKYVDRYDRLRWSRTIKTHADNKPIQARVRASPHGIQLQKIQLENRNCLRAAEPSDPPLHLAKPDGNPFLPGYTLPPLPQTPFAAPDPTGGPAVRHHDPLVPRPTPDSVK